MPQLRACRRPRQLRHPAVVRRDLHFHHPLGRKRIIDDCPPAAGTTPPRRTSSPSPASSPFPKEKDRFQSEATVDSALGTAADAGLPPARRGPTPSGRNSSNGFPRTPACGRGWRTTSIRSAGTTSPPPSMPRRLNWSRELPEARVGVAFARMNEGKLEDASGSSTTSSSGGRSGLFAGTAGDAGHPLPAAEPAQESARTLPAPAQRGTLTRRAPRRPQDGAGFRRKLKAREHSPQPGGELAGDLQSVEPRVLVGTEVGKRSWGWWRLLAASRNGVVQRPDPAESARSTSSVG